MKSPLFRTLALLLLTFSVGATARAQSGGSAVAPTLKVSTADGSVQANGVTELRFPAGAVQISGRTATVNPGSGSVSSTATQPANLLFASPSGAAGPGQWRRLVNADVDAAAAIAWSKVSKTMADIVATLGYTPLNSANNLSDLGSASTARTNLGLGNVDNTSDATKNAAAVTLTNKTLTTPTIASFANATHGHQDAAGGGSLDAAALGSGTLAAARMPALTGDVTTSAGAVSTTLASVGTPGTYTKVTTDAKGRITSGTTLSASDVPVPSLIGARVYNSASISVASATATALTFNSERFDTAALHDTASNTDRLVAPSAGYYQIACHTEYASNTTGFRSTSIRVNAGGTIVGAQTLSPANGDGTIVIVTAIWFMNAGDFAKCHVYQTSGGSLNVSANASYGLEFSMFKVGN